ncbi:hypothetical protein [Novipirellula caenicola]|uniref:Uncharacterized protein n=1 Tax=Novipirellula caenicola TaxID=1536901 RepID=A0ABP9VPW2_9BACT
MTSDRSRTGPSPTKPLGKPMSTKPTSTTPTSTRVAVSLAAIAACIVGIATFNVTRTPQVEPPAHHEFDVIVPKVLEPSRDVVRAAFFDREVEPEIAKTDRLNRDAADRCIQRIGLLIRRYHRGVTPFVNDLTSISTRLGIVKRMPGDWWREDNRIQSYVAEKFEKHLFSEQDLTDDIAAILDDFRKEIDANQKSMLVNVHASLAVADLPEVRLDQYETFYESISHRLQSFSAEQGATSVYNAIVVILISEAGSYAATTIVAGLLTRFTASAAVGAAAGAGTTAGAAATGAGGGSFVGPVGTVVGLGVGLAVGLIIDWWMTEKFESKVSEQLHDYLDMLEATLIDGAPRDRNSQSLATQPSQPAASRGLGSIDNASGLKATLPLVCDQLVNAYRDQFFTKIVSPGATDDNAH